MNNKIPVPTAAPSPKRLLAVDTRTKKMRITAMKIIIESKMKATNRIQKPLKGETFAVF